MSARDTMDGPELSKQERMILNDIEGDLRADRRLDRRLRTLRRGIRPWTGSWRSALTHRLGLCTCLLAIASTALFVRAVATAAPVVLWLFAGLWVLTATCLLLLLCRWGRDRFSARSS
ncbi:DUF3040 domain-containing protein [Streptomyces sp. APSN-46.1]|uniref:DUF3040 domain-containing protein n=1 Tax=Streptomyces sp. APSN-46.1 TaxID=2929049 RepID=UPI001FB2BCBF|nr:DUF3040 domain-containing protein [Streptomyces sp. APSN-46.1]MCJ1678493.1 DUF3040 domain-containing protein [Streptomyces sp. APSN-46.1]